MSFHKDLLFDGTRNLGKVHKLCQKTCICCGSEYMGTKQSRTCSEKYCMGYSNREYQKRNLASILEKRKHDNPDKREYTVQDHPTPVKVEGHCNHCGIQFNPISKYEQYCPVCKRTKSYEMKKCISIYEGVDINLIIDTHNKKDVPIMQIIETIHHDLKNDHHQTIFDMVYEELRKRGAL
jgi:hypothetical protein